VVYDARDEPGSPLGPVEATRKLPIQAGNQTVGYLQVQRLRFGAGAVQEQFLL
jgi:hypothetical protein